MDKISTITDKRISSTNILVECTFREYLAFAKDIIGNNEFQRKRVKTSKTVYALLKEDLQRGCVIPPIVLAISSINGNEIDGDQIGKIINENKEKVLILDGLQRTYTLIDADSEMQNKESDVYEVFCNQKLRLEIYTGINKFGILYRMLTLNTGQTPMSFRHQLEMLYSDIVDKNIEGIKIVKDNEGKADPDNNEFVFKNTIDGFHSYLSRSELPIDREELLDNIKVMEKMAEEAGDDIYPQYLRAFHAIFKTLRIITNDYEMTAEDLTELDIKGNPFGSKASKVFSTSQAMTGFGAAIGKLKDTGKIEGFSEVVAECERLSERISDKADDHEWFAKLLQRLEKIKNTSKRIGNAQRMLFQYFFRELLNKESDSYLEPNNAIDNAYEKYISQVC